MSRYFQIGARVLWNPSNNVAELFARTAEVMSALVDKPTGMHDLGQDEYEIDLPVFEAFVDTLARRYLGSSHLVLRSLVEGFLATAIVMVERAEGGLPALTQSHELFPRDIQVGPTGTMPLGDVRRLRDLADDVARAMPR
ncbi:DUF6086 family protein [Catellatospora tritici]|uniref:DUF6086 family protein n=1 Tax=Catellatospora tritici TaxID=2851566 RepID=UPI001C2CD139|nr:DUF6086 family protein [Catellatospora tritici]MBV1850798.1 hypothetical protein [Catellatospora tritici]MBV1851051.1 hypothetical protein [Catellatospora tritici]